MDFNFINEHIPLYVEAAKLTLIMAFWGILLAIVVGLIVSLIRYFKVPVLDKIVGFYIELSRNTPLLIQLFFLYFGLPKVGIVLTSEQCGVIGLAFLGGSYMAEAFRSGLDNVESIQIQSALSLGMKKSQAFRYVILPQAVSNSIPAIGIYYKTDEALFMLVIAYLIILLPISLICSLVERRVRYAEYGD